MKIYIYNNKEYEEIPYWIWPETSPVSELWFTEHGGIIEEREDPPVPEVKHYSKLQILLHMRADLPNYGEAPYINGDHLFINALDNLDLHNAWNAAEYISTDYKDYEEIVSSVKQEMIRLQLVWHKDQWTKQGYSEQEIIDKAEGFKRGFNVMWMTMENNIKKYGEA